MSEMTTLAHALLVVAAGAAALLVCAQLAHRLPLPSAAVFLLGAAAASNLIPGVRGWAPIGAVVQIAVVALVIILFDGGLKVGWHRLRSALLPAALLGMVGTAGTAAAIATVAHYLLSFPWTLSLIVAGALAPTDPAVMFSALRGRPLGECVETTLEAESGLNDPVGIAVVVGALSFVDGKTTFAIAASFLRQIVAGAAVGVIVGAVLPQLLRRARFTSDGLYGIAAIVAALLSYSAAAVAGGSGFLAVFVAGALVGAEWTPRKAEIERFTETLASFAEMTVFAALGLTIDLSTLQDKLIWWNGLVLALLITVLVRPLLVMALTQPFRFTRRERLFIGWAGVKGAVPILLAGLAVISGFESERMYGIVFLVVAFSVVVQGASVRLLVRQHLRARPRPLPVGYRLPRRRSAGARPHRRPTNRYGSSRESRRHLSPT